MRIKITRGSTVIEVDDATDSVVLALCREDQTKARKPRVNGDFNEWLHPEWRGIVRRSFQRHRAIGVGELLRDCLLPGKNATSERLRDFRYKMNGLASQTPELSVVPDPKGGLYSTFIWRDGVNARAS